MQKLQFESAWDKTIAPKDRRQISDIFHSCATSLNIGVHFSFLWEAENHKNELLVTALIHNYNDTSLQIKNAIITYQIEQEKLATGIFNVHPIIPGNTSMTCTFIFSSQNETTYATYYTILNTLLKHLF